MNIASAAAAVRPSLPVSAGFHAPTGGAQFARELGGLTLAPSGTASWRSAGPVRLPAQGDGGELPSQTPALPLLAKPIFPGETSVPAAGTSDDDDSATQASSLPAPAKTILPYKFYLPSTAAGDPLDLPMKNKKAAARRSTPQDLVLAGGTNAATQAAALVPTAPPADAASADSTGASLSDSLELLALPADASWSAGNAAPPPKSGASDPAAQAAPSLAAGSNRSSQDLAFATRVQPIGGAEQSALPAEMAASAAVASAGKKVVASAADGNSVPADPNALLPSTMAAPGRDAQPASLPSPAAQAPASANTEAPTPLPQNPPHSAAPLKDISLQVTQADNERVDVRVVQQGNEVHVSVHSGDASLSSGLRQGLAELQGRLEENGYRAEMWRPTLSVATLTPTPGGHSAPDQSRGGDQQSHSGGSQQDGGRRNPNQPNQPRWVEELQSSLDGGENSLGGSHGFSS